MRTAFVVFCSVLGFGCLVYAGLLAGGPGALVPQQGVPPASGGAIGFGIGGGLCIMAAALVLAFGRPSNARGELA